MHSRRKKDITEIKNPTQTSFGERMNKIMHYKRSRASPVFRKGLETINQGLMTIFQDKLVTMTFHHENMSV